MRSLTERIEAMYAMDRMGAWTFVAVLWCTVLFVLYMVWQAVPDPAIRLVLAALLEPSSCSTRPPLGR